MIIQSNLVFQYFLKHRFWHYFAVMLACCNATTCRQSHSLMLQYMPCYFMHIVALCEAFLSTILQHFSIWAADLSTVANHSRKIDESCERDNQCIVHAFCRLQMTCLCDMFYAPSLDKASCHVIAGARCSDAAECSTMANAECREGVCTCKDDFMIDAINASSCFKRPTRTNHFCQGPGDCEESMEMAKCYYNKCACLSNHHFANETGTCLKDRGLYQPCKKDYECFLDDKNPNALECRNGECACREGEANCNKGSPAHQSIFIVLATLAFGTIYQMLT